MLLTALLFLYFNCPPAGCGMRCLFCSNPDTQSMTDGHLVSSKDIAAKLQRMEPYLQV
jgi:pyruvate-formate lyase-activating enzyme